MFKLKIIPSTVRDGRQGVKLAEWAKQQVERTAIMDKIPG